MILSFLYNSELPGRIKLALLILSAFCVVISLVSHEFAHGYVAYKLGDPTAKRQGRLTLNPAAHLDPVGALLLLTVGFGWANPVPIDTRYFKKPRRDIALVSAAGPIANFLLALLSGVLYVLVAHLTPESVLVAGFSGSVSPLLVLGELFVELMFINLGLGLFNLIPLPPLDGSNILVSFLKPNAAARYLKVRYYTRYIFLGVMAISLLSRYSPLFSLLDYYLWLPLMTLRSWLTQLILAIGELLFGWL